MLRVNVTAGVAKWYEPLTSVADLSAGDAEILRRVNADDYYVGDFAPGYEFTGPIEETIDQIPHVDLFVFSETIEHINDPWGTVKKIRSKADHLVLSTPWGAFDDPNPEHLWAWDEEGIQSILQDAGWKADTFMTLTFGDPSFIYSFQIFGCS